MEEREQLKEREQRKEQEGKEHIGILVFGAVFVDIKGYPFSLYRADGRNAGKVVKVHGGVSRNIVEDIANLELRPTYISVVDEDAIGEEVIRKLNRHKVNTRFIKRLPGGLGTWLALFDTEGELVGSISQRPDLSSLEEVIREEGDYLFSHCDSVIVEIDMEAKLLKPIFALAEKYNKKIYAAVSNMSIALERRDLLKTTACIVCNQQEAGMLFSEDFMEMDLEEQASRLSSLVVNAQFPQMIMTLGAKGAIYAEQNGNHGHCKAKKVHVLDTAGAGDAFFAGVATGLSYGKSLEEACEIGTRLAASVLGTSENVNPRYLPEELGLKSIEE